MQGDLARQQMKVIRHRDQKAMVAYAKENKASQNKSSKARVTNRNSSLVIWNVTYCEWSCLRRRLPCLDDRLNSEESERSVKPKLARRANAMKREKDARMSNLSPGWWLKRPKEEGADVPAMERLVGPVAYRGRSQKIKENQEGLQDLWGTKSSDYVHEFNS